MKPALNQKKNSARIDERKLFQYIQGTLRLLKMPRHLTLPGEQRIGVKIIYQTLLHKKNGQAISQT